MTERCRICDREHEVIDHLVQGNLPAMWCPWLDDGFVVIATGSLIRPAERITR